MLPDIALTTEQANQLKHANVIGDALSIAGEFSISLVQKDIDSFAAAHSIDRDIVEKALIGQNLVGIPDSIQPAFLTLAYKRQQLKRAIIKHVLTKIADFGLSEWEKLVADAFLDNAHLFDDLFASWREVVVDSAIGRQAASDPSFMTELRTTHKLNLSPYVFSVITKADDTWREQSLMEAFPDTVSAIVASFRTLADDLRRLQAPPIWIEYIASLATFYENSDPSAYEAMSKQLDRLFLRIDGRLVPVHAMEVYEDPGKYCVSPELRLCAVDERYKNVNDGIADTKLRLIGQLKRQFAEVPSFQESLPQLERATAAAYTSISEAGASLTIRPFGENIPNWADLRAEAGVRIFIFMEVARTRWVGEKTLLESVIGKDTRDRFFKPYIDSGLLFDYAAIVAVGGHEIAHNAFITEALQDRLSPPLFAKLEEHKANLTILSQIDALYTEEEQKIIALYELGYSLMKLAQANQPTVVAYVNYAIFAINTFLAAGVLIPTDSGFTLDVSPAKIQAWVALSKGAFHDLVPIYDHGSTDDANRYTAHYFMPTATVRELISRLS